MFLATTQFSIVVFENCETKQNEVICKISKEKILLVLHNNYSELHLISLNDNVGYINLDLVYFDYNYEIKEKEDIFISITKLLVNTTEKFSPIAYETNVTDIPEIT